MKVIKTYALLVAIVACTRDRAATSDVNSAKAQTSSSGAPAAAPASRLQAPASRPTILFIGTSLTAGYGLDADSAYPLQIQRMIDSASLPYTVVNVGVSGETSSALVRRLDWLMRQPYAVAVVETGANDGLRGIPVETMESNIEQILTRLHASRPEARIALIQMEAPPNLGSAYTQRFRAVFPEVASRTGSTLLPFLLQDVAGRRELNQADGMHPNYEGERRVARNVWKGLRPMLQ